MIAKSITTKYELDYNTLVGVTAPLEAHCVETIA